MSTWDVHWSRPLVVRRSSSLSKGNGAKRRMYMRNNSHLIWSLDRYRLENWSIYFDNLLNLNLFEWAQCDQPDTHQLIQTFNLRNGENFDSDISHFFSQKFVEIDQNIDISGWLCCCLLYFVTISIWMRFKTRLFAGTSFTSQLKTSPYEIWINFRIYVCQQNASFKTALLEIVNFGICKYNCERCIFVEYLWNRYFALHVIDSFSFMLFLIYLFFLSCFKSVESNVYMPFDGAKLTHVWFQRMLNSRLSTTAVWFLYLYVGVQFRRSACAGAEEPNRRGADVPMHRRIHNVYPMLDWEANEQEIRSLAKQRTRIECGDSDCVCAYIRSNRMVFHDILPCRAACNCMGLDLFRTILDLVLLYARRQTGICVYRIDELLHFWRTDKFGRYGILREEWFHIWIRGHFHQILRMMLVEDLLISHVHVIVIVRYTH